MPSTRRGSRRPGVDRVVYRSTLGDNVTVGEKCYNDSTTLPSGTVVPDRTILVKGMIAR